MSVSSWVSYRPSFCLGSVFLWRRLCRHVDRRIKKKAHCVDAWAAEQVFFQYFRGCVVLLCEEITFHHGGKTTHIVVHYEILFI